NSFAVCGRHPAANAAAPMADYTMPLRGHGIITAGQTALPFAAAIRRQTLPPQWPIIPCRFADMV
ncbi:hypothetical protein, partial [Anaerotruncus colihominis]|uniref:hypothetical protein n=1 Tax=Anaerotruncus colihominis TaxID=169435 RepID=UPI0026EC9D20